MGRRELDSARALDKVVNSWSYETLVLMLPLTLTRCSLASLAGEEEGAGAALALRCVRLLRSRPRRNAKGRHSD